jgi:Family of unknown function (DUF6245)
MKKSHRVKMTPATIRELAAAMQALGAYDGENTEAEHEKEAQRLGVGKDYYRLRLANALLGIVETEAMLSEGASPSTELMLHAHQQALDSAGAMDSKEKLLGFLRWRTLRIAGPLRHMAQDRETGPIPVAASWAADALQHMLTISSDGHHRDPTTVDSEAIKADLNKAKESLTYAIANLDIIRDFLEQAEEFVQQSSAQSANGEGAAQTRGTRVERASKLLLLDMYVPLCVKRRRTDFFLPAVDWETFQKRAQAWGIWRMAEDEFVKFEKKKMREFTKTLATIAPEFPLKVFTLIDTLMATTAKATNASTQTSASSTLPQISELLASVGQTREKLFALARHIEPDMVSRFRNTPPRNPLEALLLLVDELFRGSKAIQYPVPDNVRIELARFFAEHFPFSRAWPYTRQKMQAALTLGHPDFRPDIPDRHILEIAQEVEKLLIAKLKEEPGVTFQNADQAGMTVVYLTMATLFDKSHVVGGDMHEAHHVASVLAHAYEFSADYPYTTAQIREALKSRFRLES